MKRLLPRLFAINVATFLVSLVLMALVGVAVDGGPLLRLRVREAVALSLPVEGSREQLAAHLERLDERFGGQLSVYGPDGELLASTVDPPLPHELPEGVLFRGAVDVHDEQGKLLARVVTGPVRGGERVPAWALAGFGLVCFCAVALLLSYRATRRIVEPLTRLGEAAEAIGAGQFERRVHLDGDDELAALGRTFDEMSARLQRLQQAERELLAAVSHEFRTPLARMRVALDMLREGDEDSTALIPELETDMEELDRLIERVLEVTREGRGPMAGVVLGARERVAGAELLERVARRFRSLHGERELRLEVEGELPALEIDLAALLRAYDNLLENAVRYTDGPIELHARRVEDTLVLAVVDHGSGIAPERQHDLFAPFTRAEPSRSRATGGAGLGLSIVRRIVEAHGGRVSLESRPGCGSRFAIHLPVAR